MGFKEDNKEKYLDPFKRLTVNVKTKSKGGFCTTPKDRMNIFNHTRYISVF